MKQILRITKAELQVLFYSPIAWFILIVFMVQLAMLYFGMLNSLIATIEAGSRVSDLSYTLLVQRGNTTTFLPNILRNLFYFIPMLTMGIMSKELSSGSIKLLFSSPINNTQIVLGKFLSIVAYAIAMSFLIFLFIVLTAIVVPENFSWSFTPVALLGIFLLICAYGAVGIFMSSLTSYQMVSMLSTMVVLTFFSYVGSWWQDIAFVRDITYWLSMNGRAALFTKGMFCTEDFLYFVTVIFLFLSLTVLRLRIKREKMSKGAIATKYISLFAIVIAIAYISSRPALKKYYDATRFERLTLTKASQEIISDLEGDYDVTTYINLLDRSNVVTQMNPRRELRDINVLMAPYTRFKPSMKLKYVYYLSYKGEGYLSYKDKFKEEDEEIVERILKRYNMELDDLLTEEEALALEPTIAEDNFKTIKVIEGPDGKRGIIRYFNDMTRVPTEPEISAAFKRMITEDYPKVAFIEGRGERSIHNSGDLSYSSFTDKYIRSSLYNQGFDVTTTDLTKPIAKDINILVIADPRSAYTAEEMANYNAYIERGGNLIVLGETLRSDYINPLMKTFGYKLADGCLVEPKDGFRADIVSQRPTEEGSSVSYFIRSVLRSTRRISTPSTTYLEKIGDNDYSERVLLSSQISKKGANIWNELQTRYFEAYEPEFNPESGETQKIGAPIAIALDRERAGRTQKIMIAADADFFSNVECGSYPHKIPADNRTFITGIFEWMSDGISPIDMRRPSAIDNKLGVNAKIAPILHYGYMWGIPLLMLIAAAIINIRRRSK